ncbi:putative nucleotidyltransferase [Kribbella aluminosa]|uniref:Nucleotidyltransferase n=1 Tax=Kribbella aluminosa TaxID=416017 RepID=A0ABS4UCT1_9ACTN|nr:nucleotidyltransferase domain-containing protein [Kribbella aluminosa]MBP2349454.1 putative nucleotidyltransferase [Kribbella aluminosa]
MLAALARTTQPLTGRRVHQLAEVGSESGVRKVLTRLVDTGLVTATAAGPSVMYVLNRKHLAADAVLDLVSLPGKLVHRLTEAVGQWEALPVHVSLFGSVARGEGGLDSDIDLLVVHAADKSSTALPDKIAMLAEQVHEWTGNFLQTYAISIDELANHLLAGEPIVNEWLRDCITVYGHDFRRLHAEVSRNVLGR